MSPVIACGNGKYRIGSGKCMYDSKEKAEASYRAYLFKRSKKLEQEINQIRLELQSEKEKIEKWIK